MTGTQHSEPLGGTSAAGTGVAAVSTPAFERLLDYLKEVRGFDFTGYKRASLVRRVQHRMDRAGVAEFEEYHGYLQVHPEEFTQLFNTILINVTGFFRDSDAWDLLAGELVPALLDQLGDEPIRLWSAACASGQEAYSLAMVFAEALGPEKFRSRVKIYATDIDEEALNFARLASYTERELAGLPDGYRERYFQPAGTRFQLDPDLRRSVIFGRNDLLQDAPISRIDLLACRNALMYFNAETQARIVSRLSFALKPQGVLFLGKAEMLLNHSAAFEPIDLKRRFFRRRSTAPAVLTAVDGFRGAATATAPPVERAQLQSEAFLNSPVAQIVLDHDGRIQLINHAAGATFGLSARDTGRNFSELEISYRPAELRSYIDEVGASRQPAWLRGIEWHRSSTEVTFLDIQVLPLTGGFNRLLGVSLMFNDVSRFRRLNDELETSNRQLETAYEELQSTNEELETTNEELQSTVEELETTNEELQSTNEELETTNEELQSTNDELHLTNQELQNRTAEVSALNRFLESILSSLSAAAIVVSPELTVRTWNRQAYELWGVREDEAVGQHLLNLDIGLPTGELRAVVREVAGGDREHAELSLQAVNRRGRPVELRVTVTTLADASLDRDGSGGALLLMDGAILPTGSELAGSGPAEPGPTEPGPAGS
ncbi:CheR family methyltransferase [Jatrophihabitans sp.]|uniref:CheR family methyltransferase n=1 Tax=Jatrophihabitans sp. TaxID=1932789 RepID=UPI002F24A197